ncbi:FAD-dependent oxidoreductase [Chloroflexota bacterium]
MTPKSLLISNNACDNSSSNGGKMAEQQFKHLFTPLKIGPITVPNRLYQLAANPRFYAGSAAPSERAIDYYEARAKGGIGLIVTSPHYASYPTTLYKPTAYHRDDVIPAWKKSVDAIHKHGVKVFAQLHFSSNTGRARPSGGGAIFSASSTFRRTLERPAMQEVAHEMSKDDIRRAVESHGEIARRAKEAGNDGIEITVIINNVIESFLSPVWNMRTDEYGGSLENRMRFLLEIIDVVRDSIGPDLALGIRFSADEYIDNAWWTKNKGYNLDDAKEIAKRLEATGKVDYLHPCGGGGISHSPPMEYPPGTFVYLAAGIKEAVNLPVCCDGRINDPVLAERILSDGQADMIGMYRALCADPEFVNKAKEGKLEEICRCIGCCEGCHGPAYPSMPLSCTVNPEAGREKDFFITPAEVKKSVLVIGGGGAGLEAARVASLRGHRVSLYEKNDVLANDLRIAAKAPGRESWDDAVRYYVHQMKLLGVDVHLGTTVTEDVVKELNYDVVVVATGALPFVPEVPGFDSPNVVEAKQVLAEEVEVGQNVIVMAYENHMVALSTAAFLADRGKKVEVLVESIHAAGMTDHYTKPAAYSLLANKGVAITPLTSIKELKGNTVVAYDMYSGAERQIDGVDTVVFAIEGRPNDALYRSLEGKVKELYLIGQALAPRKLLDSVADAYQVVRKV